MIEAAKGVVPENTKRRNAWARKNFTDWAESRNSSVLNSDGDVPVDLLESQDAILVNKWLCKYIMETRQSDGTPYPPKSLYSLLCGLHRITQDNQVSFSFLDKTDSRFMALHKTLDSVCSDLHSRGIGANSKAAGVISYEHEDLFWEVGALSYDTPRGLFNCVFFYVGLSFCLCGGQEQRSLSWKNFRRIREKGYDKNTYYEYTEFVSKNNQHRFRDIHSKNKNVRAYANCDSCCCLVQILDCYRQKVPKNAKAFYLCPLKKVPDADKPWFANVAVGVNTLNNVIKKITETVNTHQPDSVADYTNHPLRATCSCFPYVSKGCA